MRVSEEQPQLCKCAECVDQWDSIALAGISHTAIENGYHTAVFCAQVCAHLPLLHCARQGRCAVTLAARVSATRAVGWDVGLWSRNVSESVNMDGSYLERVEMIMCKASMGLWPSANRGHAHDCGTVRAPRVRADSVGVCGGRACFAPMFYSCPIHVGQC